MRAQGAGLAAAKILAGLKRDGLAEWRYSERGELKLDGWTITPEGRKFLESVK